MIIFLVKKLDYFLCNNDNYNLKNVLVWLCSCQKDRSLNIIFAFRLDSSYANANKVSIS